MRIAYLVFWRGGSLTGPFIKIAAQAAAWTSLNHEVGLFVGTGPVGGEDWSALPEMVECMVGPAGAVTRLTQRRRLSQAVAKWQPEVLYLRHTIATPAVLKLARHLPTLIEINGDDRNLHRGDGRPARMLNRLTRGSLLRSASGIVSVTGELGRHESFGPWARPTLVLGNGIDLDRVEPLALPRRHAATGPRALMLAHTSSPWNGIADVEEFAGSQPDWHIDVVGIDRSELVGTLSNLTPHAAMPAAEFRKLAELADVGIGSLGMHVLGQEENSALKVREYLALGLPVISGCDDPDVRPNAPWWLRVPNRKGGFSESAEAVDAFVSRWRGERVARAEIQHLDLTQKEATRLRFVAEVSRIHSVAPAARPTELRLAIIADARSVHTLRWVNWFATHGHTVHLYSDNAPGDGLDPAVTTHDLQTLLGKESPLVALKRDPRLVRRLRQAIASVAPDVVHGHFLLGYGHAAALGSAKAPLVLTAWGSDVYLQSQVGPAGRAATRLALRRADLVISDSSDLTTALTRLGVPTRRIREIGFGVDTTVFTPSKPGGRSMRKRLGIDPDVPVVLSARSVRPIYRIPLVVESFRNVLAAKPESVLVVKDYRGDPDEIHMVKAALSTLPATSWRWVDELPHTSLPDLYASCDVVVSLAKTDSSPVTALEAWSCGTPVVACEVPSLHEWFSDLDSELLVSQDRPEFIAAAMLRALKIPREDLSELRKRATLKADHEQEMRRAEGAYASLVVTRRFVDMVPIG